jgi:IS605 OrfB family transposase
LSKKYENKKKRGEKAVTYSANIAKQVKKVQAIHMKLANIRKDYTNKVVNEIVKNKPSHATIEDLNVSGMMKNHKLAKSIQELGLYEMRRQIEYKAKWYGREVIFVSRWFPSSKMCSCCGNIKHDLKLSDREYVCENCGLVIDRDENAAINIEEEGIRLYEEKMDSSNDESLSVGQRMSEFKLVEHPTAERLVCENKPMDDKDVNPLKSSGVMKQENVLT